MRRIKTNAEKALITAAVAMFITQLQNTNSQLISEKRRTHMHRERGRGIGRVMWVIVVLLVGCASIGGLNI